MNGNPIDLGRPVVIYLDGKDYLMDLTPERKLAAGKQVQFSLGNLTAIGRAVVDGERLRVTDVTETIA